MFKTILSVAKDALRVTLRIFGNKKTFDLDGDGKVETMREEVRGLFSQFQSIHDKLDEVNDELSKVIEEEFVKKESEQEELRKIVASAEAKIAQHDKTILRAKDEQTANMAMKGKVSDFVIK